LPLPLGNTMRAVLYADDMEPITVIELSGYALRVLQERRMVNLEVRPPSTELGLGLGPTLAVADMNLCIRVVTIRAEDFYRSGQKHTLLFTANEESAMLLKSAFLPGQRRTLQDNEREAFAKGFLTAIENVGR
jgi:hypothetical protein